MSFSHIVHKQIHFPDQTLSDTVEVYALHIFLWQTVSRKAYTTEAQKNASHNRI